MCSADSGSYLDAGVLSLGHHTYMALYWLAYFLRAQILLYEGGIISHDMGSPHLPVLPPPLGYCDSCCFECTHKCLKTSASVFLGVYQEVDRLPCSLP